MRNKFAGFAGGAFLCLSMLFATAPRAEFVGDFAVGTDNICHVINGYQPSTGASFAIASAAVDVYKDDSDTQDNDSGLTIAAFDSLTGAYMVCVDTSADGTFYSAGSMFHVLLSVGTVDSVNVVGSELMSFSLAKANVATISASAITATVIATDAIGAAELATGAIAADAFAAGAIDAAAIATDAVGAAEVAAGAIAADAFGAGAIDATAIAADAIGASEIAANALTTAEIATGAISADEVADDAIDAGAVAAGAIDAGAFAAGAVDAAAIATDAIGSAEIATDAIGAAELAANAIAAAEIADGAIDEATFATTAGSFEPLNIVDQGTAQSATSTTLVLRAAAAFADDELIGSELFITGGSAGVGQTRTITDYVNTTDTATVATWTTTPTGTITYQVRGSAPGSGAEVTLAAGAISASTFAAGAIDAAAIAADAIGASELAANAVGASELADDAVDAGAIAADAIAASEVAANAIGAAEVADGAIDEATFATTAGSFDFGGIIDQGTAQAATSTTLQLRSAAAFADDEILGATCLITGGTGVGQSRIITDYVSSTDTATVATWTTTPSGTILYECFGTAPGAALGEVTLAAGAITSSTFASGAIDAAAIATDAIGAAEVATDAIGAAELAAGAIAAAEIATDAIDADAIAADALGASEIAASAVGASELATDAIGSAELADGGITSAEFGSGAITATVIATDAIGAAEIAADAIAASEIATDAIGAAEVATDAIDAAAAAADLTTELQSGLATSTALNTVDDFLDTEIASLMLARTQILVATADSGDGNTLVDAELTFANAQDIDGAYVVRSDGQRCFVDSFTPATDTIEFACTFTGAWSTQAYKLYPAGTQ